MVDEIHLEDELLNETNDELEFEVIFIAFFYHEVKEHFEQQPFGVYF